jgi:hypothetical protein
MLIMSVSKTTTKSAVEIWKKYEDVTSWKSWDPAVEKSELLGEFTEGAKGKLKPTGGPETEFVLTDITKYIYFADRSKLPFAYIDFEHSIDEDGTIRTITHTIKMGGFLAPLFKLILGKKLASGLEEAVGNLVS